MTSWAEIAATRRAFGLAGVPPAVRAFLFSLLMGVAVVWWRADARADALRRQAGIEANARALALGTRWNHALSLAGTLGRLLRQQGVRWTSFSATATDLLPQYPGLVAIEWQPGGVTTEVVPRRGNEHLVGFNVLRDPASQALARNAMRTRQPVLAGPLRLPKGEAAVVLRHPVFLPDAAGNETFAGFVSATLRLADGLAPAGLADLGKNGYDYLLYSAPPPPQQGVAIAAQGNPLRGDAVQCAFHVAPLEFRLAIRRAGGWFRWGSALFEGAIAVALAGLMAYSLYTSTIRRQLSAETVDARAALAREQERIQLALEPELRRARETAVTAQLKEKELTAALVRLGEQAARFEQELQTNQAAAVAEREASQALSQATLTQLQAKESALLQLQERLAQLEAQSRHDRENVAAALQASKKNQAAELRQAREIAAAAQLQEKELAAQLRAATENVAALQAQLQAAAADLQRSQQQGARLEEKCRVVRKTSQDEWAAGQTAQQSLQRELKETKAALARSQERCAQLAAGRNLSSGVETAPPPPPMPVKPSIAPMPTVEAGTREPESPAASAPMMTAPPTSAATAPPPPPPAPPKSEARQKPEPEPKPKTEKSPRRYKAKDDQQPGLFADFSVPEETPIAADSQAKPVKVKRPPPFHPAAFRKAANVMALLLTEADPGAMDCLKDTRPDLRPGFPPEGFEEFEKLVKAAAYAEALELLRRHARKHGLSV